MTEYEQPALPSSAPSPLQTWPDKPDANQYDWPITQVTSDRVLRDRAETAEKKLKQLRVEYIENTYDKTDVRYGVIMVCLCTLVGYCFGMAYRTAEWEHPMWAGYLTAGITIPICCVIAVALCRWHSNRNG